MCVSSACCPAGPEPPSLQPPAPGQLDLGSSPTPAAASKLQEHSPQGCSLRHLCCCRREKIKYFSLRSFTAFTSRKRNVPEGKAQKKGTGSCQGAGGHQGWGPPPSLTLSVSQRPSLRLPPQCHSPQEGVRQTGTAPCQSLDLRPPGATAARPCNQRGLAGRGRFLSTGLQWPRIDLDSPPSSNPGMLRHRAGGTAPRDTAGPEPGVRGPSSPRGVQRSRVVNSSAPGRLPAAFWNADRGFLPRDGEQRPPAPSTARPPPSR